MSTVTIPLGGRKYPGLCALVDEEDVALVRQYTWHPRRAPRTFYVGNTRNDGGVFTTTLLHRLILNAPADLVVDHIDGDGLNNQRANLRLATCPENLANRREQANNTSGFKGVVWDKKRGLWRAQLHHHGRSVCPGMFGTPEEAARCYDIKARELFGAFAHLNFPD